jgi:hypothetical protein
MLWAPKAGYVPRRTPAEARATALHILQKRTGPDHVTSSEPPCRASVLPNRHERPLDFISSNKRRQTCPLCRVRCFSYFFFSYIDLSDLFLWILSARKNAWNSDSFYSKLVDFWFFNQQMFQHNTPPFFPFIRLLLC